MIRPKRKIINGERRRGEGTGQCQFITEDERGNTGQSQFITDDERGNTGQSQFITDDERGNTG